MPINAPFESKNFSALFGTQGFSDKLLKDHFALYEGYIDNTNKLTETGDRLLQNGKSDALEYAEMKRRFAWEFNGIKLHEYYFWNITKESSPIDKNSVFFEKIIENFGSYLGWEKDFRSVGLMRGIGWAMLCYEPVSNRLFNAWINGHDQGFPIGAIPLLIMDVFEHAYMADYGIKRADYIEAFFKAIDWKVVINRF